MIKLVIRGSVEDTFLPHEENEARKALARAQDINSGTPAKFMEKRTFIRQNEREAVEGPYLQYAVKR